MNNRDSGAGARWRSTAARVLKLAAATLPLLVVFSCSSTYRAMSSQEKRDFLVELEQETLAELVETYPDAEAEIDSAVGYAVFSNKVAKIPMVGAGEGIGFVFDRTSGDRTYLKVGRLDLGGGLGVREYRLVVLFFDEKKLMELASGKLELGAGVEAGAKDKDVGTGAGGIAGSRKKTHVLYQLSDKGVSATVTVRLIRYSVLDLEE